MAMEAGCFGAKRWGLVPWRLPTGRLVEWRRRAGDAGRYQTRMVATRSDLSFMSGSHHMPSIFGGERSGMIKAG
jgi:hypothetical protein